MAVFGMLARHIGTWKYFEPAILAEKSTLAGRGYLSGTVVVLMGWKSPQGLQVPSGLGTTWRGLDHGEEEC